MNICLVLFFILFIVMIAVGGTRGLKSFLTLVFNFIILFTMFILILFKIDPIKVTIFGCIIISYVTLFFINGYNVKTYSSLLSVTIVVLITMLLTYRLGNNARIQGFSNEEIDSIQTLSLFVQINFAKIVICQILIGLLGAIIDVSISISSSMNELFKSDSLISQKRLFSSGMNIGKDILGTMTNTLLFAFIGEFMALIILFNESHYSLADTLNAKVFCSEVFQILCSGIGIILIIPVTAFITSKFLSFKSNSKQVV